MGESPIILKSQGRKSRVSRVAEAKLIAGALESLKTVPNLDVERLQPRSGQAASEPDFTFVLVHGRTKFKVATEVKRTGEPSVLRRSAAWLKNILAKTKHDYAVIVAPFISQEGAAICHDLGVGFIDLSGNCLLSLGGLYVERSGHPNRFKKPREIQSLFSPKSSRIIRCLLSDPKRSWTLKGLARESGVSIGLIHRIATGLEDNLFAKKDRGAFRLEDPARLLEVWREEYYRRAPKWERYVIKIGSVEDIVRQLKTAAARHKVTYALSGPSGASFVLSYLAPAAVHLYVDVLKDEFLEDVNADSVSSGGNLLIRIGELENEFNGSREIKDIYIVGDLQLYLDLWAMGGRAQEAAEELRRGRLRV